MFDSILDWIVDTLFPPLFVGLFVLAIVFIPLGIWSSYKQEKSPTFELYKNEWVCTESASKKVNVMVGKVMTTQYRDVCVTYSWSNKEF